MLGANLRQLARNAASISALCRELGINRTQFNRYLAGESFPRPDVLHRICAYFDVDARILLEPVEQISEPAPGLLRHPAVEHFLGNSASPVPETDFPSGFYRFTRRSFLNTNQFLKGLVFVFRQDDHTFLRGFEAREAMIQQGLPVDPATREFRGAVLRQEDGVAALVSRKGAATASFNYLARIPTFENNFWVGYVARTVREGVAGSRVERQVYEYLGNDRRKVLPAARDSGFCAQEDLIPFHNKELKIGMPFD